VYIGILVKKMHNLMITVLLFMGFSLPNCRVFVVFVCQDGSLCIVTSFWCIVFFFFFIETPIYYEKPKKYIFVFNFFFKQRK